MNTENSKNWWGAGIGMSGTGGRISIGIFTYK